MKKTSIVIACMLFLMSNVLLAQNKYVGAAKCKMCHMGKGKQYPIWSESKHAKAFETLKGDAAKKIASEKGIADPSTDAKCLKCHATAATVDASLNGGIKNEEGVSCESCHGPGSAYKSPVFMKNKEQAMKNGLILPDKNTCIACHNKENPFYKEFNFETYSKKIAHPNPAAKK